MPGILSQEELERRRKILGMLGSDHDGEVLAAVKQLRKAAAARKLTLVEYILDGTSVAVSPTYDYLTIKQKAAIRKILTKYRQYLGPVDW
jgi:hypothetical protein